MALVRLSELVAQDDAAAFLRGVVAGRRVANAYLFHGPPGVGKGTAALAFARALLCTRGAPRAEAAPGLFDALPESAPAGPEDDACGRCDGCRKAATLQHPDFRFLFPVSKAMAPEKKSERAGMSEEEWLIADITDAVRTDPYYVFEYKLFASILISMTREALAELAYRPFEAGRRVIVVRDADRMRQDQYSPLLKSIEEPGASTVWILTTSRPNRLPATIRSRCQRVRFRAWPEAAIRAFLEKRAGVDPARARVVAALAAGSLGRALQLREVDAVALRDEALALLEPALRDDPAGLWQTSQRFMKFGRTDRETLRRMVEVHQLWLRDVLRARYGATHEQLVNREREEEIRALAATVDAAEARRRLMVLEEMLRAIEGNVTPELAMFSGLARLAGSRMGEGEWPRHAGARWDY